MPSNSIAAWPSWLRALGIDQSVWLLEKGRTARPQDQAALFAAYGAGEADERAQTRKNLLSLLDTDDERRAQLLAEEASITKTMVG